MKKLRKALVFLVLLPLAIEPAAKLQAQMVSPSIDHADQPFSYFPSPPMRSA